MYSGEAWRCVDRLAASHRRGAGDGRSRTRGLRGAGGSDDANGRGADRAAAGEGGEYAMSIRRPLLLPLTPLYAAALAAKRLAFRLGWPKQRRLAHPVISIGSVSAGGAGKTPVVMMLAEMLRRRGYAVSILTRGFGRAPKTVERVDANGDPAWFGDEPVLMAQRSGVPVFVGANRYQAGLLAEQSDSDEKIAVHLLDDGFQHRK